MTERRPFQIHENQNIERPKRRGPSLRMRILDTLSRKKGTIHAPFRQTRIKIKTLYNRHKRENLTSIKSAICFH